MPTPLRFCRVMVSVFALGVLPASMVPVLHAAGSHAKPHKESKRADSHEIEALESEWRDAMVKSDAVSLSRLLSDDFLGIFSNGTVSDKQQYLRRITVRQNQLDSIDLMDMKVRMHLGTAVVVSQARVAGQLDGRPLNGIFRYTMVYSREASGWHILNFEATRVSGPHAGDSDLSGGLPLTSSVPMRQGRQ